MYRKFISAFQMLNILFQAIYTLALPIGLGALASYLLTRFASAPKWIWAVFMVLGTIMGFYSMIKYILTATAGIERLEKEREAREESLREKKNKQEKLKFDNNEIE